MPVINSQLPGNDSNPKGDGLVASMSELIALGGQVKRLKLDFTAGARSVLAGAHLSRFRGRGMDYAESRDYQPGDDVRHIDWRVTARTGRAHSKLYVEERERPVFVVMDFSPGMYFGTRGALKSVTASRAAACVAWSVVQGGDRVGAVLATPTAIRDQRPAAGRHGALRLIGQLVQSTRNFREHSASESGARLGDALQHAARVVHPGSLILVFSDFYQQTETVRKLLTRLGVHNDIVACQVLDIIEHGIPAPGQYLITDGHQRQTMDTRDRDAKSRYQQMLGQRDQGLSKLLQGLHIPLVRMVGNRPVLDSLVDAFGKRTAAPVNQYTARGRDR